MARTSSTYLHHIFNRYVEGVAVGFLLSTVVAAVMEDSETAGVLTLETSIGGLADLEVGGLNVYVAPPRHRI